MRELGRAARHEASIYFTGGATAVLLGWRATTLDADLRIVPDSDPLLSEIPRIKESLRLSIELAAPSDFIPELPGWQERSLYIAREGRVSFYHYDLYSQALAKIERGHAQDHTDVGEMMARGLVEPARLLTYFEAIEPVLYRYPAVSPEKFRAEVQAAVRRAADQL